MLGFDAFRELTSIGQMLKKRIYSLFYILRVLESLSKKIEYFRYVKGIYETRDYILKSFRKYLVFIYVLINLKRKDNFF